MVSRPVKLRRRFAAPGWCGLAFLFAGLGSPASAGSVGVKFVGGPHGGGTNGRDASLVTGVAGVVPQGGWNNVAPWTEDRSAPGLPPQDPDVEGSFLNLLNDSGEATPIDVSWFSDNTYYAENDANLTNEDTRLMDGYIDIGGDPQRRKLQVTLTEIPFERYDLYIYVGSDGDNRVAGVSLNAGPQTFFVANTGRGKFLGPADYRQATATTLETAFPSNFILHQSLEGPTAAIELEGFVSNAGIHAVQVVDRSDLFLLEVDAATGEVWIVGKGVDPSPLVGYQITSDAGALRPDRLRSLSGRGLDPVDGPADPDSIPGNSEGESWEVLQNTASGVIESRLFGSTAVDETVILPLGKLFDPAVGMDPSMAFSYALETGPPLTGIVRFISSPLTGDYDRDGDVDLADYEVWRASYGSTGPDLPADGARDGRIDAADYAAWRDSFASSVATAVPEPCGAALLLAGVAFAAAIVRVNPRVIPET